MPINDSGAGGVAPTAAAVADAVWDELIADHAALLSYGNKYTNNNVDLSEVTLAVLQAELDARFGQEDVDITSLYPRTGIVAGVANVQGAWVQLVADVGLVPIVILAVIFDPQIIGNGMGDISWEVEIGTGAAAAEARALGVTGQEDFGTSVGVTVPTVYPVSRRIPAGSRLSVRWRNSAGGGTGYVTIIYRIGA